jgi:hypothetical protein
VTRTVWARGRTITEIGTQREVERANGVYREAGRSPGSDEVGSVAQEDDRRAVRGDGWITGPLAARNGVRARTHNSGGRRDRPDRGGLMARIEERVTGWWIFAGTMLLIAGVLNVIWGIAAIGDAKFFIADQRFILSGLHTWGWITLIIGVVQLLAGGSLYMGGGFGRWMGMIAASLSAISALLSIPAYPFWSICIFALALIIIYELAKAPEREAAY